MAVSRSHAIILTPKDPDLPHRSVENNFNDANIGLGGGQCKNCNDANIGSEGGQCNESNIYTSDAH